MSLVTPRRSLDVALRVAQAWRLSPRRPLSTSTPTTPAQTPPSSSPEASAPPRPVSPALSLLLSPPPLPSIDTPTGKLREDLEQFQFGLESDVNAHILASPLRRCAVSGANLPCALMMAFRRDVLEEQPSEETWRAGALDRRRNEKQKGAAPPKDDGEGKVPRTAARASGQAPESTGDSDAEASNPRGASQEAPTKVRPRTSLVPHNVLHQRWDRQRPGKSVWITLDGQMVRAGLKRLNLKTSGKSGLPTGLVETTMELISHQVKERVWHEANLLRLRVRSAGLDGEGSRPRRSFVAGEEEEGEGASMRLVFGQEVEFQRRGTLGEAVDVVRLLGEQRAQAVKGELLRLIVGMSGSKGADPRSFKTRAPARTSNLPMEDAEGQGEAPTTLGLGPDPLAVPLQLAIWRAQRWERSLREAQGADDDRGALEEQPQHTAGHAQVEARKDEERGR